MSADIQGHTGASFLASLHTEAEATARMEYLRQRSMSRTATPDEQREYNDRSGVNAMHRTYLNPPLSAADAMLAASARFEAHQQVQRRKAGWGDCPDCHQPLSVPPKDVRTGSHCRACTAQREG